MWKMCKNNTTFGQRLRNLRKDLKLSQAELAKILGFSANTRISRLEKGNKLPTTEKLIKLSEITGADLHWLLTGKPSPTVTATIDLCVEALKRFAPYIGSRLQGHLEERICYQGKKEELLAQQSQGIIGLTEKIKDTEEKLAIIEQSIKETIADLDWIQDPYGAEKKEKKT